MILKGSQRAGAKQLSAHLLNERDNEHVTLHELRGFVADDLRGALAEAHAISRATKCKQFLFSLSLNPPRDTTLSVEGFERAADLAEKALGLEGQPRAMVFHEKEGRRHAHVVWSRIDAETMRAINLPHFKNKLTALSRELFLDHEWQLPDGLRADGGKNPLNFTLSEWQQAKRLGRDPREIKATIREAFERSDSVKALGHALSEKGYFLAQGDRRGVVAVDVDGEVYALAKWAGVKAREARDKLTGFENLPSVAQVQADLSKLVSDQMRGFIRDVRAEHAKQTASVREPVEALKARHTAERETLTAKQNDRWAEETRVRSERFRSGLLGLFDAVTGKARTIRQQNEAEQLAGLVRDRAQRDGLVELQLAERRPLQAKIETLKKRHAEERKLLAREISQSLRRRALSEVRPPEAERPRERKRGPSLER